MDSEEDWLLRPVRAGMLPYSALDDPAYDLEDFLICAEYLDVETENGSRIKASLGRR